MFVVDVLGLLDVLSNATNRMFVGAALLAAEEERILAAEKTRKRKDHAEKRRHSRLAAQVCSRVRAHNCERKPASKTDQFGDVYTTTHELVFGTVGQLLEGACASE